MKKMMAMILTAVLLLTMLLPALAEEKTYDLDASKLMNQWVYIDSTAVMTPMGQIKEGETAKVYPCYGLLNVVYCANPESARIQHLDIYVPTEYVKEAVTDELMRYTSAEAMAPDLTVYISEEDRAQVEIDAEALYTSLNSKYNLGRYSITMDDAVDLLLKRTYYNKVFDKLSEDINMEISEAQTKAIEISYVFIPAEEGVETAEKLRDTVRGGENFASICETMGYEPVLNQTVTRGSMPAVFEEKAFVLRDNEVSEIIEARDGYYIIYCIEDYKVAESIANKNRILADAKKEHFEEAYQAFAATARMRFNEKEWEKYDISLMERQ